MVAALRGGEADRFDDLVRELTPGLTRMARMYVTGALAGDVVQDTWLAVIDAIDTFEGRSSLKTWIYRILLNKVRTLATREAAPSPWRALDPTTIPPGLASSSSTTSSGLATGRRHRSRGRHSPPSDWNATRPSIESPRRSRHRRPRSERSSSCATSRAGRHPTPRDALGITDVNQRCCCTCGRKAIRNALEEYLRAS